jgi:hypothetical protein
MAESIPTPKQFNPDLLTAEQEFIDLQIEANRIRLRFMKGDAKAREFYCQTIRTWVLNNDVRPKLYGCQEVWSATTGGGTIGAAERARDKGNKIELSRQFILNLQQLEKEYFNE